MKKATHATERSSITEFQQLINIGPSIEGDFKRLGLTSPQELIGNDAVRLYQQICALDQSFHDPCVLDCFLSAVDFMNGNPPQVWWNFTAQRKQKYTFVIERAREEHA